MKSNKIVYKIAILLSAFFVLNCGGLSTTNGGGHGGNPPKVEKPKAKTCAEEGKLSIDNTGTCFKAEAIPANFGELVDLIDKKYATDHNADLNKIDVSKITKMTCLFAHNGCKGETGIRPAELVGKDFSGFNGKIDKWNTSSVKIMHGTFAYATNFNSDISGWDVSNVTSMTSMFNSAVKFNQDLDSWNVRKVMKMNSMFLAATAMSYPLESWGGKLPANASKEDVFSATAVSTGNNYPTWCVSTGFLTGCR